MNRRITLGQTMILVALIALEFGVLPAPIAIVAGCVTLAMPFLSGLQRWIVGSAGLILAGLLVPPISSHHRVPNAIRCKNNLRQISLALTIYHQEYGCFPPAYLADASGKPMHSWRVLILPYIDGQDLYKAYNFDEPWNSLNNLRLLGEMPSIYRCPDDPARDGVTSYLAITGPGTVFPPGQSKSLRKIRDGPTLTIMATERSNSGIWWLEPRDLDVATMSFRINDPTNPGISAQHIDRLPNASMADGSSRRLDPAMAPARLKALTTISGGEPFGSDIGGGPLK